MNIQPRDAPYPELKRSHTMAHTGRPWTDVKPPPAAPIWSVINGLGAYHLLLAALDLGVFDALHDSGPTEVGPLAERLHASSPHLRSLLDSVVALGLLEQCRDVYDLNDTARRYLVTDGPACMAGLVPVAPGPHDNWTRLADTVRNGRPETPIEEDPAAFYIPLVEGTFTTMLRAAMRAEFKIGYRHVRAARVLDLGAGGAPWPIAILTACPDATAVVNDFDAVLDVARRKTAEHGVADRCEFRPGDFHDVEIEDNAYDIVVLSHVCRTEGVDGARHLIERAHAALKPEGRLLLADYFCDRTRKANAHAVLLGATMMASTRHGFTFTHEQFSEWIAAAEFLAIRLIEPIGFQQVFVATKGDHG